MSLRYRSAIDGLRAVAVLGVLWFHAFPEALRGGFVGVDVFFVISGFLISSILYEDFGSGHDSGGRVIGRFYVRRVRRIFPALVTVMAVCFVLGLVVLMPGPLRELSVRVMAAAGFFLNFLLARDTGYFHSDAASNPVLHLWSLSVEEQFYLIWPLLVWLALRTRLRLVPIAVFLAAGSYLWCLETSPAAVGAGFFLPVNRLWELLAGALAAAAFASGWVFRPAAESAGPVGRAGRPWLGDAIGSLLLLVLVGLILVPGAAGWAAQRQFLVVWPVVLLGVALLERRVLGWTVFAAFASLVWTWVGAEETGHLTTASLQGHGREVTTLVIAAVAAALLGCLRPVRAGRLVGEARWGEAAAWAGLGMVLASYVVIHEGLRLPGVRTLLPVAGTVLLLLSPATAWVNRRVLSQPILVWVGLISYPLYLWHWVLLAYATVGLPNPNGTVLRLALLGASVALAALTYRFVEQPLRRGKSVRWVVGGLVAALLAVVAVAACTYRAAGFPARFPPLINALSSLTYDSRTPYRYGSYYLDVPDDETHFKVDSAEIDPRKPTMFLWGDSHAAALYPGMAHRFGGRFNIVERALSASPPYAGRDYPERPNRLAVNTFVLESIRRTHPQVVVLAGYWNSGNDWRSVIATVDALHAMGVPQIVLVGPLPLWFGTLPQQICSYYLTHRLEGVPTHLRDGVKPEALQFDREMEAYSRTAPVTYVSPCQLLHSPEGYVVRLGDDAESVVAFDYGHLTVAGSRYLVDRFPELGASPR